MADLIDRQALLEQCHWIIRSDGSRVFACHAEDIEAAPTAQPTRSEIRRLAIQNEVFPVKRGECDTCGWHNACNWETLMKDWDIEHGYCAAYSGADMRGEEE